MVDADSRGCNRGLCVLARQIRAGRLETGQGGQVTPESARWPSVTVACDPATHAGGRGAWSKLGRDSRFAQQIPVSFRVQVRAGGVDGGGVHIGKGLVGCDASASSRRVRSNCSWALQPRASTDLDEPALEPGCVRRVGGGRHTVTATDGTLLGDLKRLVEPASGPWGHSNLAAAGRDAADHGG
jgi:hypothetical protein